MLVGSFLWNKRVSLVQYLLSLICFNSSFCADLICGLVAALLILVILVLIAVYVVKSRNLSSQPHVMACNGNGHINGKRCMQAVSFGHSDGHTDIEGQEMEVYIPMLKQIPPDFKTIPLDTKVSHYRLLVAYIDNVQGSLPLCDLVLWEFTNMSLTFEYCTLIQFEGKLNYYASMSYTSRYSFHIHTTNWAKCLTPITKCVSLVHSM